MDNVVESIFGLSPAQIQQRQNVGMMTAANNYASQDPLQRAAASMFAGGGMLAGAGAQAAGMMTPDMQQAQMTEQALQGLDTSDPKAIFERASQIQDPRLKLRLVQVARKIQAEQSKQALEAAHAKYYEMDKPNINPKDYTPESLRKYSKTKDIADLIAMPKRETRTYQKGENSITEELQSDGTWKEIGSGPKFSKSVINVGTGVDQGKEEFEPDVVDFYATQALMTGDQSWRTGLGRSKDGVKLIIAVDKRIPKLAAEVGMTAEQASNNKQMFASRLKSIKDFATGTQGQMVNSFNTAIAHLDTLKDLGEALKNNDTQLINKAGNTVKEWFGNADVTNLDTAKQIVGAEIIKAIVARGGGQKEREEAASRISRISSPEQLIGYINTTQDLLAGQLYSLENQYKNTTQRNDFGDKLLPRSKDVLARLRKTTKSNVNQIPIGGASNASVSNW